jgi:putative hydrolase of the HAD superfamily
MPGRPPGRPKGGPPTGPAGVHARPEGSPTRRPPVWFFDLDNTLHDASHAIFRAIDSRMTSYVERHLAVDRAEADRLRRHYWLRYGATLLGLVRHHGVDARDFLHQTHDFEVVDLLRAERGLGRLFARLPGRKVLLTNAPERYARAVVRALAIDRHLGARYTIETMRLHGSFRPKPSRAMLRHMLARERVARGGAVLVEDSAENLRAARAVGFRTVLVTRHHGGPARPHRRGYVGLRLRSVLELPRARARLRG